MCQRKIGHLPDVPDVFFIQPLGNLPGGIPWQTQLLSDCGKLSQGFSVQSGFHRSRMVLMLAVRGRWSWFVCHRGSKIVRTLS